MNQFENIYAAPSTVAMQDVDSRARFVRKTYYHLAGALGVFALIQAVVINMIAAAGMTTEFLGFVSSPIVAGVIFVVYLASSFGAEVWAHKATSLKSQYMALSLGVLAWSLMFVPLLTFASTYFPGVIGKAAVITICLFGGLTFIAFTTKKDFSFLGGILKIASFVVLGLIGLAMFGAIDLGVWFSVAMVVFAAASILLDTSNIIHKYQTHQYVAASLSLFASVALLFWYIIRILLSMAASD